jgi:alginate O-acetyltransferase complex protein AlgJ
MRAIPQMSEKTSRWLLIALLLFFPALTLWNLYATTHGKKKISIGRPLAGVVDRTAPVSFSLKTIADGSWQKKATNAVVDALPTRPLLIRASNNIRVALFGHYGNDQVVVGDKGHLIEKYYVNEYCRRDIERLKQRAPDWIANLKELQDFYTSRNKIFIYSLTPSKMAHFPELFLTRIKCASGERDRSEWLPVYTALLKQAGIHFVDGASSTHALKGKYPIDIFPQGGVHWNAIGYTLATNELIAEINRQGFNPPLPPLKWKYEISEKARGLDRDLLDLVNVLLPNPRYPTARVTFERPSCPAYKRPLEIAYIGGSFIGPTAETLNLHGCLPDLKRYNYLYRGLRGGDGYKLIKSRLTGQDIRPLREADIVILEENEAAIPAAYHLREFYRMILRK